MNENVIEAIVRESVKWGELKEIRVFFDKDRDFDDGQFVPKWYAEMTWIDPNGKGEYKKGVWQITPERALNSLLRGLSQKHKDEHDEMEKRFEERKEARGRGEVLAGDVTDGHFKWEGEK